MMEAFVAGMGFVVGIATVGVTLGLVFLFVILMLDEKN